jgi:hypothetical protein
LKLLQMVRAKMAALTNTKRVRLTRSIILDKSHDAAEGEVLDLPLQLADQLIWDGSAVPCGGANAKTAAQPRTVERMGSSGDADPRSRQPSWRVRPQDSGHDLPPE